MSLSLTLQGAEVLRPEGWSDAPLGISGGVIADADGSAVDLSGYRVLPGIVDLHGDGFERHVAPRRGALRETRGGLIATEAELAANGITTAWLAQFWSWEGGLRGPEFAEALFDAWGEMRGSVATDLRVQLRLETHMVDDFGRVAETVARHGIGYLVFNDHLQHARLVRGAQAQADDRAGAEERAEPRGAFRLHAGAARARPRGAGGLRGARGPAGGAGRCAGQP